MNIKEARSLFVGAMDKTFMDSACVGLAPTTAKAAISRFLDMAVSCDAKDVSEHHIAMDGLRREASREAARLLFTDEKNVVLIENTTQGLNIAANCIPFSPSDEVVIGDIEYLQVAMPFVKKHEAKKLCLVPVKARPDGRLAIEDIEERINGKTKAICLSSVQWCTGQRVFSEKLGKICRDLGIWLIIDAVQEVGALSADLDRRYCDFYIAGGHKWLNAPYGCGFMYMSERAQGLEPWGYGYLNLKAPMGGWGEFFQRPDQTPFRDYAFDRAARSFGVGGTGNYPGAIGLAESIKIVNGVGGEGVEKRVLELTAMLRQELTRVGARVMSPADPAELSGITIFRVGDSPEQDRGVLQGLLEKRILLSIRYTNGHGGLRASAHYFNDEDDILRLAHAISALKG